MTEIPPSVLIIGYQRVQNIERIVNTCIEEGIRSIYISVDFPKTKDKIAFENYSAILDIGAKFENSSTTFKYNTYSKNLGCATHVISACDWVFELESNVIILEDDCLPSEYFFKYCSYYFQLERQMENLILASGSQFAPNLDDSSGTTLSKYALIWGWATTRQHWERIKGGVCDSGDGKWNLWESDQEKIYWQEGARRAKKGFVDAWDTPLVNFIWQSECYSLAPKNNLVSNVGDDHLATHTGSDFTWLRKETGEFCQDDESLPTLNLVSEAYLRNEFYRIRRRHLLSTRITRVRDLLNRSKKIPLFDSVRFAKDFQIE
jgi:hypothetical protein